MPSKNTYRLINPSIEGSLDTVVSATNSFRAGKKMYNALSSLFTNHVKDYHMTLQNVSTKENIHFHIKEEPSSDNKVNFKLVRLEEQFPDEIEDKLTEIADNPERLKQKGGKKKRHDDSDSDSDSSSSSEEYDTYHLQPVTRYVYYNLPYQYLCPSPIISPVVEARTFIPLFSFPINPTVEVLSLNLPISVPWF